MLSLIELDRLEGVEPPLEMVNESRSVLSGHKVRAVPPVPLPEHKSRNAKRPRGAASRSAEYRLRYWCVKPSLRSMILNQGWI